MPCGSATGAWACTTIEPAESKSAAKMMEQNANMPDWTRWGAKGRIIDLSIWKMDSGFGLAQNRWRNDAQYRPMRSR
jgi:hypothetical protein